jgi:hypothetical protein
MYQALRLASNLNIPILFSDDNVKYPYGYDGNHIRVSHKDSRCDYDLVHELCHWICSTPERRLLPEFGLGEGFSTYSYLQKLPKRVVTKKEAELEENATCILSFILMEQWDMDVSSEAQLTSFDEPDHENMNTKALNKLIEWDVIDTNLEYTGKYRNV